MVLVGWFQPPPAAEKKEENHRVCEAGTSNSSRSTAEPCDDAEIIAVEEEPEVVPTKKRKLPAEAAALPGTSNVPGDTNNHSKVEEVDDDDDDVMVMLDGDSDVAKKRKLV